MNEDFLDRKLQERSAQHALRRLRLPEDKIDFCSNDYLGIARGGLIGGALAGEGDARWTAEVDASVAAHGSAGSRLLAGNYPLIEETERALAAFHEAEAGLIFNSGYDANLGVLSAIPQRGDTIFYDALSHASIRDGIRLSFAKAFSFAHNDLAELEKRLIETRAGSGDEARSTTFVVTESVFSMDGDMAPLAALTKLCGEFRAQLIVDEAHATGVVGSRGEGLVQALGLTDAVFARVHTFGKAVGCHGAIVLGSARLRDYLINFSRPFIYTTALPPASVLAIRAAYALFPGMDGERAHLRALIGMFQRAEIKYSKLASETPIQGVIVPGNAEVKRLAEELQTAGLDIRPILYPTVPKGAERLRIVLHAYNSFEEMQRLLSLIKK